MDASLDWWIRLKKEFIIFLNDRTLCFNIHQSMDSLHMIGSLKKQHFAHCVPVDLVQTSKGYINILYRLALLLNV